MGDLIGSGASQEQTIVGETPNLAARLQGIAEPNSVVIAENTRRLVGNLFELKDLGAKDLRRIAFIVFAQKVGLALEEIAAELAKLPTDRIPARQDWARLSGAWTKRIDQRIAELQRLRAGLTQCIGCGCLSIDKCKLANPADRAGRRGPGPRYWLG